MPANTNTINDTEASHILSQLRDQSLSPAKVRRLVGQWTTVLSKYVITKPAPEEKVAVIVILRSGLAMADPFLGALPEEADTVTYHLGLFREKVSLRPVEYYNKLPAKNPKIKRAYVLDPLVATGGTATAAIDILRDWGVDQITFFSLLASEKGLEKVASIWPEGTEVFVGAVDEGLDEKGYVQPGLGDIGDRLFGTSLEHRHFIDIMTTSKERLTHEDSMSWLRSLTAPNRGDGPDGFVVVDHSDSEGSIKHESPETINEIKEWLKPTDSDSPASEYRKHLNSRAVGTGEWILKTAQYREWSQSDSVGNLWIRGIPGCGKSVVAASMISRLQRLADGPVLFFFFREIIQSNRSPRSLVQGFCHKLLDHSPSLQSELKQHRSNFPTVESVPFETLWGSLSAAMRLTHKVHCVVDALDEMEPGHDRLIENLLDLGRQNPQSIKLVVTSRQVPYLEKHMSGASLVDLRLDRRNVARDISIFISQRLEDSALDLTHDKIEDIKRAICERGKGLFLYARLMLNQLLLRPDEIAENVDNLPDGLGDMYTNLLRDHATTSATSPAFQRLVLQWITHSARPMRLLELASMIEALPDRAGLDPDRDVKMAIRTTCGPLLEVCEDGVVQIIHHSLTEFILNRDVEHTQMAQQSREFAAVDSPAVHGMIARACIRYLSNGCLQQWDIMERTKRNRTTLLLEHYFLNYAIEQWPFHLNMAVHSDTDLLELAGQFCRDENKNYEAWKNLWAEDKKELSGEDCSPLHIAAYCGITRFAAYLLSMGADPNSKDTDDRSPLVYAVMKGHDGMVSLLLHHNADHDIRIKGGQTLIHYACKLNHVHVLHALIEGGADPMAKGHQCRGCGGSYYCEMLGTNAYYHSCHKYGTPLAWACEDGHVEAVRELMKYVDSSHLCDGNLHIAAREGQPEVAKVLLQNENVRNAINERDSEGNTALYLASRQRCSSTIQVLLDHGADVRVLSMNRNYPPEPPKNQESAVAPVSSPSYTPLHAWAIGIAREEHDIFNFGKSRCEQDVEGSLEALLKAGCDINARDHRGRTPLFGWSQMDWLVMQSKEFVALCLDNGADATVVDHNGASLLHPSSGRIWKDELRLFVDAGVDINLPRKTDGMTALMLTALEQNHIDPTLFHQKGADFNQRDYLDNTALHHYFRRDPAGKHCWLDAWLSLSNMHLRNHLGRTPLHEALYRQGGRADDRDLQRLVEMLEKLLKHGASLESRDGLGRTALLIALVDTRGGSLKLVNELLKLGADATAVDFKGKSALHYAFKPFRNSHGDSDDVSLQLAQRLIDSGASIGAIDYDGNTVLHDLISHRPIWKSDDWNSIEKRAMMIIELGGPVKQTQHRGRNALHIAAALDIDPGYSGMGPIMTRLEFLLQESMGFDVNAPDHKGITALHLSAAVSDTNTMILIQHGANVRAKDCHGRTPMHYAAQAGQSNVVGLLTESYLQQAIPVDDLSTKRRSPLHEASRSGCSEAVKLLLDTGADPSLQDERGRTALHAAAEFEHVTRARRSQARYDHGLPFLADPKRRRKQGQSSPLSQMKLEISDEDDCRWIRQIVRSLISAGADPQQLDYNGHRPFDVAVSLGCLPVVDELRYALKGTKFQSLDPLAGSLLDLGDAPLQAMVRSVQVPEDSAWLLKRVFGTGDDRLAEEVVRSKSLRLGKDSNEAALSLLARWGLTSTMERLIPYVEDSCALIPVLLGHAAERSSCNLEMVEFLVKRLEDQHKHPVTTKPENQLGGGRGRGRGAPRGRGRGRGGLEHHVSKTPVTTHPLAGSLVIFSTGKHWWHPKALSLLLDAGVDATKSFKHSRGTTSPLQVALKPYGGTSETSYRCKWNEQTLKLLLQNGADVNHTEPGNDWTPLVTAISGNCEIEIIKLLIDHGASVSLGSPPPIMVAINENDINVIELLLQAGVDPNGTESDCPLLAASGCRDNDSRAMSLLLQYGADPLRLLEDGKSTVLHQICDGEHWYSHKFIQPILAAGVNIDTLDGNGRTPLIRASSAPYGREDGAALALIQAGANVHATDRFGSTALHYAAENGNLEVVEAILKQPLSSFTRNHKGMTPLCVALDSYASCSGCGSRFYLVIQALLDAGEDALQILPDGRTALHCIAAAVMESSNPNREAQIKEAGRADIFSESTKLYQRFVDAGCDREAPDNEGNTPIFKYVAAKYPWDGEDQWVAQRCPPNPEDYTKIFAKHDVHKVNRNGDTLLHTVARREACDSGRDDGEEMFSALVKLGLSPWKENNQGQTPLDIAATTGKKGVLALFAREE
ncbi:uncharacterized protein N7459_001161 [Penicillium hispanicum]|uniref:uncharacterized protein n=1 Tax=Penicillium hispanicum TaxID=1080232 RepID=UPI0025411F0F|nr:uncharacterized protein N7459_001161 [Penicillium hispanicum]KAJ5594953.1 hypothetical protein N7459_001161 [Penicillium hispanicum]